MERARDGDHARVGGRDGELAGLLTVAGVSGVGRSGGGGGGTAACWVSGFPGRGWESHYGRSCAEADNRHRHLSVSRLYLNNNTPAY